MNTLKVLSVALFCSAACGVAGYSTPGSASGGDATTLSVSGGNVCGTGLTKITYAGEGEPVFNTYCTGCHSPGGDGEAYLIDNYADAQATLSSHGGAECVDSGVMPKLGSSDSPEPIDDKSKCIIDAWVAGGYAP